MPRRERSRITKGRSSRAADRQSCVQSPLRRRRRQDIDKQVPRLPSGSATPKRSPTPRRCPASDSRICVTSVSLRVDAARNGLRLLEMRNDRVAVDCFAGAVASEKSILRGDDVCEVGPEIDSDAACRAAECHIVRRRDPAFPRDAKRSRLIDTESRAEILSTIPEGRTRRSRTATARRRGQPGAAVRESVQREMNASRRTKSRASFTRLAGS